MDSRRGYLHVGYRCDQCKCSPIVGVRFHCQSCKSYDLCQRCRDNRTHPPTHKFRRILKSERPSGWGSSDTDEGVLEEEDERDTKSVAPARRRLP